MSFNEKLSYTEHSVVSPTSDFTIGFEDYALTTKDRINVTVNDIDAKEAGYTVTRKNNLVVTLTPPVSSGVVRLQRETNIDTPFHRFTAGAKFVASNVDQNFTQILHSQQEVRNLFGFTQDYIQRILDNFDLRIQGVEGIVLDLRQDYNNLDKRITKEVVDRKQGDQDLKGYIDALVNGITGENFLPILDEFVYSENGRPQKLKNEERISVLDFGAIGDGTLHTVSELIVQGVYSSLADIQKDYRDVTSLTDSLDWAATMRGIRYLISRGGGSLNFPNVGEAYVYNKPIEFPANTKNITLRSDNANLYMDGVRIGASDPESVHIQGFNHIRFSEVTNNGISFGRPKYCTVDVNRVTGAGNFLVLFFATDDYVHKCLGNFIRVKYADGLGVSKGGLGMACMYMSRIEGSVTGVTQGIGYAVNFKNNCVACSADVITTRNKFGLVLSNDTGAGLATGVNSSTFTVTSYQDQYGVSVHRSQRNTFNVNYTGSGLSSDMAVTVAAHCQDNVYNVKAYNGHTEGYIFSTRSDKQDINILDTDYTFGKVGLFEPNTHYCTVLLYGKYSHSGSGSTVANYFTIDPTCRSITLQQLADAPNIVHNYDTTTGVESWQMGRVNFPVIGSTRASSALSYGSAGSFTFRTLDGDVFGYNATAKSLDSVDQTTSIGRIGRHYTGTYTQKIMYTNTLGDFYGSGSPEGVVSASIGSTYRRTDADGGGAFYRKASGTGNTGWVL